MFVQTRKSQSLYYLSIHLVTSVSYKQFKTTLIKQVFGQQNLLWIWKCCINFFLHSPIVTCVSLNTNLAFQNLTTFWIYLIEQVFRQQIFLWIWKYESIHLMICVSYKHKFGISKQTSDPLNSTSFQAINFTMNLEILINGFSIHLVICVSYKHKFGISKQTSDPLNLTSFQAINFAMNLKTCIIVLPCTWWSVSHMNKTEAFQNQLLNLLNGKKFSGNKQCYEFENAHQLFFHTPGDRHLK